MVRRRPRIRCVVQGAGPPPCEPLPTDTACPIGQLPMAPGSASVQDFAASVLATGGTHPPPDRRLASRVAGEQCRHATNRLTAAPDLWHSLRITIRTSDYDQKTDHLHRRP